MRFARFHLAMPAAAGARRCRGRAFVALAFLTAALARGETFAPRATGFSGEIGDRIAMFLPADLPLDRMPVSLCLLQRPQPTAALAASWTDTPAFSFSETRTRAVLKVPDGTSLYGTGEVTGPLLRNGHTITLWNTDNYGYRDDNGHRLYQSHPWVLAVRPDGTAFGVIADSTWAATLSLDGAIEFTSDGPSFPVIVIERDSPQAVVSALAQLTGHMALPPLWALGYQQCRWSYHPASRVREIADEFRRRHIPCDVIWMDIDYMDGFRVFTFSPKEFPDPKGLNAYLHAHGFKSVWMIDPGVKAEPGYRVYDSGTAADVWVHDAFGGDYHGSVWPGDCVFPDFTRPETRTWWAGLYRDFMAQGVDGVWNDMNEPAVFNVPSKTMPLHNWHRGGGKLPPGPHAEYHNVFGMLMVSATKAGVLAANPDRRPFVLTRSNFLGGQRYAATWTGDNASTWELLKMSIPMTLNLGLSGQPFNGPDLGGFGGAANPDLWANWVAVGAFFPFARAHAQKGEPPKEPWAFGPAVEAVARTALDRRYRLLPYYYTLFRDSSLTGLPVMRPVFFADPRDPALRAEDQAFLVGDDVLVVPKWAHDAHLPAGIWRTVSLVGEDSTHDPIQPDVRVRGGAIVPLGKVVQSTAEKLLDPLTLLVVPDADGRATGTLYEDDGDNFTYRSGNYLLTTYTAESHGDQLVVRVTATDGRRPRPARRVVVQVVTDKGTFTGEGTDGQPVTVTLAATAPTP
ncbi:MAG TPA: TIM-barrel domain-containing protein [Opitutaceae bacterium]|nr:TIM-barrel domain-containing protein [Opitutaceae bacterium]